MKKLILMLSSCGIIMNSFSQINQFDLSKYKLPDIKRTSLDTKFDFSSITNKSNYDNNVGTIKRNSNNFNGDIAIDYHIFKNSRKIQRISNLKTFLYSELGFFDDENSSNSKKLNQHNNYVFTNRYYVNNKFFVESDLDLNYSFEYSKNHNKSSTKSYENYGEYHRLTTIVPIKFGTGRVEQVQDARQAIHLIEELSKIDRMSADKSDEEIIELAEYISKLRYKRFFDTRLRRIAEIESLDSFLVAKNYISQKDAKYFTILNDYWIYGNYATRNSGNRFSIALLPGYYYTKNSNESDVNNIVEKDGYSLNALGFEGGIEYSYNNPINLYWQNDADIKLLTGIKEAKINTSPDDVKVRLSTVNLSASHIISYYPNTRTQISLGNKINFIHFFDNSNSKNNIKSTEGSGFNYMGYLSFQYFISPQLSVNAHCSIHYYWQDNEDNMIPFYQVQFTNNHIWNNYFNNNMSGNSLNNAFHNNFNISLIYSIF